VSGRPNPPRRFDASRRFWRLIASARTISIFPSLGLVLARAVGWFTQSPPRARATGPPGDILDFQSDRLVLGASPSSLFPENSTPRNFQTGSKSNEFADRAREREALASPQIGNGIRTPANVRLSQHQKTFNAKTQRCEGAKVLRIFARRLGVTL